MVIEGDLKNLMGRVTRVADDGKVDVMPSMEGLTQVLTFEPGQLEKFVEARVPRTLLPTLIPSLLPCHASAAFHALTAAREARLPGQDPDPLLLTPCQMTRGHLMRYGS